jgi:subtilisin family serine protease
MAFTQLLRRHWPALAAATCLAIAAAPAASARTVIVELAGEPAAVVAARARAAGTPLSVDQLEAYRDRLRLAQDDFLATLAARGVPHSVVRATVGAFAGASAASVEHRYTLVYNGVALALDDAAVATVASLPGVVGVHEDVVHSLALDRSVQYTRANQVYGAVHELTASDDLREGCEGQGVKVAVIDSGIEWSHEMFGGDPTPPRHGLLPPLSAANNAKVLYYLPLLDNVVDDFGHGTHAASVILGYLGHAAGADGLPNTGDDVRVHGVAPQAKLMGYKVCSGPGSAAGVFGCLSTSITLAIEDAVSPRTLTGYPKPVADVINLSLGGPGGPDSTSSVAASNAALLGAIVVASAGNDGPGLDTLGSPAAGRHVIAVGANNDPGVFPNSVEVLDALGRPAAGTPRLRAIWAPDSNLRSNITAPISGRYVFAGYADTPDQVPLIVAGNICLVERGSTVAAGDNGTGLFGNKAAQCAAKGATAVLVFNDVPGDLEGVLAPSHLPVFTLSRAEGLYLRDTLGFDITGMSRFPIRIGPERSDMFAPAMAAFSSRGPVRGLGQVKPDVTAPGVAVLGATTPVGVPVLSMMDPTRYTSANGTSFSGPHVAGAAALIKQAHPAWTPDLVRAALINYATNLRSAGGAPKPDGALADPILAQGGGLIDVAAAVRASALMGVVGDGVAEPGLLASWSFGKLPVVDTRVSHSERVTVHLLDTGGDGGAYELTVADNRALSVPGVTVGVSPTTVTVGPGEAASFVVSVTVDGNRLRTLPAEDLQWYVAARRTDGGASLRMPFYLKPLRSQPLTVLDEETTVHEGILPAGDTGLEAVAGVTYVDVPFTVTTAFAALGTLELIDPAGAGVPDLDLALLDPLGEVIGSSASEGGPESIAAILDGAGTFTWRVIGWANGPTPYTLTSTQQFGAAPPALLPIATEYTAPNGDRIDLDGAFDITWQPQGGEVGFEVERSLDGGNSWQVVGSVEGGVSRFGTSDQPQGALAFRLRALFPGRIGVFVSSPGAPQGVVVDRRKRDTIPVKTTISNLSFAAGVLSLDLAFTNQNANTYVPKVELEVVRVHSGSGAVAVQNADNGRDGRGKATAASFDYSGQIGADLLLSGGEKSGTRTLRFTDPAGEPFSFDVRVSGYRRLAADGGAGDPVVTAPRAGDDDSGGAGALPLDATNLLRVSVNPLTRTISVLPL